MKIGVPTEIKVNESRIGMTPAGVRELVSNGHEVCVQSGGGASIGFDDDAYSAAGAEIFATADEVFAAAEMIVKVKEPQPEECIRLRSGQILFTYLHLAPDPSQAELLVQSGASCIAYETVTDDLGRLPLLAPMSVVAGRMAVQAGAHHLQITEGGHGVLLGGVPGVEPASVLIIGGGVVGLNSARMAIGLGAQVTIVDRSIDRLTEIDTAFGGRINTLVSTTETIEKTALSSDLVIGAVLLPGRSAPKLVTRELVRRMRPGTVMVDVAIDQGGCFETSKPTTHDSPTYVLDDVVHYCVANMPGAVARTSTLALTNATLPYVLALAESGLETALRKDKHLSNGLNVYQGKITHPDVAHSLGESFTDPKSLFY